jgi:hypothetical protein
MTDQEKLIKEQTKFFKVANFVLAPARAAMEMVEFVVFALVSIVIGLLYPVILMFNHEPVTLFAWAVPVLVILTLFTLFYTPVYFIVGGLLTGAAFVYGVCAYPDLMTAWHFDTAQRVAWLLFVFLLVGILQKAIRNSITPPPPSVLALRKKVKKSKRSIRHSVLA